MRSQLESACPPPGSIWNGLLPWAPAFAALAGCGLLYLFFATPAAPVRAFDPRCEPWDDAASAAIARLVAIRDETAEAFFGDAVFRLRRARRNCRAGWVGLARRDYEALYEGRIGPRYATNRGR
jgi:hypothetical protein